MFNFGIVKRDGTFNPDAQIQILQHEENFLFFNNQFILSDNLNFILSLTKTKVDFCCSCC